jgi:alpha-tubulin suppressor-like RCC1 family protein
MVWIGAVMLAAHATAWAQNPLSATAVGAGGNHSMAVGTDGTVWACGYGYWGQIGDGTNQNRTPCVPVSGLSDVRAVAGGQYNSVAVKNDGTVWAWGVNWYGQLGDGTTITRYTPVQVSQATGLSIASSVAAGSLHTVALKNDGTVWAWGYNYHGQLGDGTNVNRYTPVQVPGLSGVSKIAVGDNHTVALKSDGTVWTWGLNNYGQLGDGTSITRMAPVQVPGLAGVVAVAAAGSYTVAVKSGGTVWAWGHNGNGQLGDNTTITRYTPVQVQNLSGVVTAIAAGYSHTVAVKSDGTVWAWGNNGSGQLGNGTTSTSPQTTPVQVQNLSGVVTAIAAGYSHAVARKSDGTVWAWGSNGHAQLGDGTLTTRSSPVQMQTFVNHPPVASVFRAICKPNASVTNRPAYADPDLNGTWTAVVVSGAAHGTVVGGANLVYTPNPGFTGIDSFTYRVNDGYTNSNVATGFVQVREASARAGNLVLILARDTLYTELKTEVDRLRDDLIAEGYSSRVQSVSLESAEAQWNRIKTEYERTDQWLEGVILVGDLARAQSSGGGDNDLIFWNMRFYDNDTWVSPRDFDIWVSRIGGVDTGYGTEIALMRRALDANHNYRKGISRLPHSAYYWMNPEWWSAGYGNSNNLARLLTVWPDGAAQCPPGGAGGYHR